MIRDLMALTLRSPRAGLRAVLNLPLDPVLRWGALALMAVVTTILSSVVLVLAGVPLLEAPLAARPLTGAALQVGLLTLGAVMIHILGRAAGGSGRFSEAVLAVAWLQIFLIALQLMQLAAAMILPPVAGIIIFVAIGVFFWLLTHFVAEIHGFRNLLMVFGAILGAFLLLGMLLSPVLMPMMGMEPPDV